MSLKQQLDTDLKAALVSGNHFKTEVLRGLKAAILNEEVADGTRDQGLADDKIEQLVAREIKKRNESARIYEEAGRGELATSERQEADVLSVYLPAQVTEEEIRAVITQKIAELDAGSNADMGRVIGAVKDQLGNSADGSLIAKIVKESLS